MNTILKSLTLATLTITSCVRSTPQDKKAIVIASFGEYFSNAGIKLLEQKTGAKIKLVEFASNEILYKQMQTNKYDIVVPSEYMVSKLRAEGSLKKLDFKKLNINKKDFLSSITNAYDGYEKGILWNYSVPLVVGDLRVHVNPRVDSKITEAIKGNYINLKTLLDKTDVKIGLHEDARNITWLAMNYKYGKTRTPNQATNPSIKDAKIAMKAFFAKNEGRYIFQDEAILPESWTNGDMDVIISYNTDPNWTLKDSKAYPTVATGFGQSRTYKTYKMLYNANLWIDSTAITKNAKEISESVLKAIYENYDKMGYTDNGYNPVIESVHKTRVEEFSGQELANFILDKREGYYSLYVHSKENEENYNEKLSKLFSEHRS